MLYHLPVLSSIHSPIDIEKYFGTHDIMPIRLRKGKTPLYGPSHIPRYAVGTPDFELLLQAVFHNPSLASIKICDFSESSLYNPTTPIAFQGTRRNVNAPKIHRAPEVIFDNLVSPASDIWALANTMHQIMTGGPEGRTAIPSGAAPRIDDVLRGIICVLGKLPDKWWNRWERRLEFFDEQGECKESWPFYEPRRVGSQLPAAFLPGSQKETFGGILARMVVYEPESRITAHALVEELTSMLGVTDHGLTSASIEPDGEA
jgi:serine/threonine-protein kinase SRPK3